MSSLFGSSSSASSAATLSGELSKDVTLTSPPEDSISELSWSSKANFLAVASWDGKVRVYDVTQDSAGEGKALINFDGAALSCAWSKVCRTLLSSTMERISPLFIRMANKSLAQAQIRQFDSSISLRTVLQLNK
jgi:mRNA export factor